ncbi:signal peptidase I [Streptomyces sp. NPDC057939]|uniref:signal peptidase I n=1 Tax=Streptomyces sp. NPDC057939 TaxID=3346284 RepID=UPI0036F08A3C
MEHKPGRGRGIGIAAIVLLVLGAVVLVGVSVAAAVAPPARYTEGKHVGWTMTPTWTDGDGIHLEPVARGKLRRGDVVLASVPWSTRKTQMNRVVALGGDRVQYRTGGKTTEYRLVLNGKPLDEPYLEPWQNPSTVAFDVTVPEGHVFLMADNRLNSDGSQFANNGPVPESKVVSRVVPYPRAMLIGWGRAAGGLLFLCGVAAAVVARRARERAPRHVVVPVRVAAQAPTDVAVEVPAPAAPPADSGERADARS